MNKLQRLASNLLVVSAMISGGVYADQSVLKNGTIAYVMTDLFWSVYQTPGTIQECPRGFNDGPREQFEQLFPHHEALTVEDTQLQREMKPGTQPPKLMDLSFSKWKEEFPGV